MGQDIFAEINNAVLDLQSAQYQTYERPLRRLAQLLSHSELQVYNEELERGLDLDGFIERSQGTGGSMVGSSRLLYPDEQRKRLGLDLLLIKRIGENPDYAVQFAFQFFYSGRKIISSIHSLTGQLIIPFIRDYKNFIKSRIDSQKKSSEENLEKTRSEPSSVTNYYGVVVMNSQNVTMENIHNLVQTNSDKAIGNILEALAKEIAASSLPAEKSAEMLDQVELLAEQAALAPQNRKMGIIKACWTQLVENADGIGKVSNLLTQHGPALAGFFETTFSKLPL